MKRVFHVVGIAFIAIIIGSFCWICNDSKACSMNDQREDLIHRFESAVNNKDIDSYISLFSSEIRKEMMDYIKGNGSDQFFLENNREVLSVKEVYDRDLSKEKEKYEDATVYLVTEQIVFSEEFDRKTCPLADGLNVCEYVMVEEKDEWFLYRISYLGSGIEEHNQNRSLSCPSETLIYFTKNDNVAHWNVYTMNLMWNDYLKNVLPNEWIISYYGSYPEYGKASALASKMYAWYYTTHPKWYYSPYWACMKDNSSDQNYLWSSYSGMPAVYRGYEDTALSQISNTAMVNSSGSTVFEVHYHATNGSYHSGCMSASGCLSKAQAGDTYSTILHYYYDQSTYTGGYNMSLAFY